MIYNACISSNLASINQAATEVQRTRVHRRGFGRQQLGQDILGADGSNCQWIGKTMEKPWENCDLYGQSQFLIGKKWDFYVIGVV